MGRRATPTPKAAQCTSPSLARSKRKRASIAPEAKKAARKRSKVAAAATSTAEDLAIACQPSVASMRANASTRAASDSTDDYQLSSADESTVPKFTIAELPDACRALTLKLQRDKRGHRQYGRRLKCEPFKLSASQKIMMATSYRAARNEGRQVDYKRVSESQHFKTFKNNAQKLKALEGPLLREMKAAMLEQRLVDAGKRVKTTEEWEEELTRCEVLHQKERAEMQAEILRLEQRWTVTDAAIAKLRTKLAAVENENARLAEENEVLFSSFQAEHSRTELLPGQDIQDVLGVDHRFLKTFCVKIQAEFNAFQSFVDRIAT